MKSPHDPVIVAMARSPIGGFGGSLAGVRAHDLAARVMQALMERSGLDPGLVDDVILGDCIQCPDEPNTARTAWLKAGFPHQVPAVTLQRQCASGMQALAYGALQIKAGQSRVVVAGGTESMSNAPYLAPSLRWGARMGDKPLVDGMWELLHAGSRLLKPPGYIMGQTAEHLAVKYGITRKAQDEIAFISHKRAASAQKKGYFKEQIVPIEVQGPKGRRQMVDSDEHIRPGLSLEQLACLKPVFKPDGSVTAGNSSGLNDGAAICILTSRSKADELGIAPLAHIKGWAVAGCPPREMGIGPVPATRKLLANSGIGLDDLELIELNEAFAAQYLACEQELGIDREITNVTGSGIALGHPVGATGARITISLICELKRRGLGLGMSSLCVGGGMGMSMLIQNQE